MMPLSNPLDNSKELFSEFFEQGQQESASPFIETHSRNWSVNLTLRASLLAALLLILAFPFSFFPETLPLSHLLLVGVYFLAGIPALIEAIEDLSDGEINIDILMTVAAFSSIVIGSGMEGALLLVLFALSGAMEDAVTRKAKSALSSLHKLSPTRATVLQQDGTLLERAINDLSIGTRILVKAGQIVPLDGVVVAGTSTLNLAHLTGESLPITKTIGDEVPAGGRNLEGALTIDITRTSSDSTLTRIIQLVTQAQEARPLLQRWFDRLSQGYATTIIVFSALLVITLPFILSIPFLGPEGSLYRALTFLIAASPCALIIAIPIAYLSAINACARRGILIKGGITLDALASCHAIAFDKTGTLTSGELTCISIEKMTLSSEDKNDTGEALSIALALERNVVHPMATAIIKYGTERNVSPVTIQEFKSIPGYGIEALVQFNQRTEKTYIGRPSYIANMLPIKEKQILMQRIRTIEEEGELIAVLLIGTKTYLFRFQDKPRPKVAEMLKSLRLRRWNTAMLTGDNLFSAQRIANELKIDTVHAGLTPEEKMHHVSELSQKKGLAMIGDGVNDAPALARATVGICMGKIGSTAAIDAADVVLLHDNIEVLDWLINKAKQTQTIVRQNLTIAGTAILIASIPALGGLIPLWLAVVLHEGGTVLVGLNALRLLRI